MILSEHHSGKQKTSSSWELSLPLHPITSTPTTLLNQSNFQMNLALLKQVLNFIIIFLDPPLLGCQPECAQEMWRVISWGECWKFFKVIVGGLDCEPLFLFSCLVLCITAQRVGEPKFFQLCQVQILFLPTCSQFPLYGSSSASNNALHFPKLATVTFKSR